MRPRCELRSAGHTTATFHLSTDLLGRLGVTVLNHGSVRQCLKESGVSEAVGAGRLLDDMQGDRVKADYRLNLPFTAQIALINVERAHQVQSFLAAFDQENAAADLQSGLKEYMRRIGR